MDYDKLMNGSTANLWRFFCCVVRFVRLACPKDQKEKKIKGEKKEKPPEQQGYYDLLGWV